MILHEPGPDPLLGQTIAGRFEVLECIGEGGMGVVYKARQHPIGRLVALKLLLDVQGNETTIQRFMNEAKIISNLRHPNNVHLIDFGQTEEGQPFIAMEYVGGGSLGDLMEGRRIGQVSALRIVRQICGALAEAHACDIIHRDLKPDNVLLDDVAGEDWVIKVVDFGLAKLTQEDLMLTAPGTRLGTAEYMSPEQAFARPVDATTDLYSLGVILYRMLTGHLPFDATGVQAYIAHAHEKPKPLREMAPDLEVEPEIEGLVEKLLAKQPEDRPRTAQAVGTVVDQVLARLAPPSEQRDDGPVSTEAAPRPEAIEDEAPVGDLGQSRKLIMFLTACVVLLGGAVLALLLR